MTIFIGTSGWQYKSWKEPFYRALPQRSWLDLYVEAFATVEINNAFYRLPPRSTFVQWAERTPSDFLFAVKASRYLTHIKRLKDPAEPVRRLLEAARGLGSQLGPILLQLPPNMSIEMQRLRETLEQFPDDVRVTVEFRHDSWFTDDVRELLVRHNAALCLADSPRRKTPLWRTADWGYLRFHEGRATPPPCYDVSALQTWADELTRLYDQREDVYVYFNNDTNVCAPRDAGVFAQLLAKTDRVVTRTPDPSTIHPVEKNDA